MNDQSPLVRIEGVSKHFGDTVALDNLTLDIASGEFVTFLGPSGCGKSTTLRILGGFERPTTGRVILGGEDVTFQPPEKRHVNMVFQDYALFPHMTVAQNISFGLELKGMSKADIRKRLDEIMTFLELDGFGARYPGQLSGGQRQRVQDGDTVMMDWFGQTLSGHAPGGVRKVGDTITASVRLEKLSFHSVRPDGANVVQGTVVGKTFLGSRMAVDVMVADAQGAKLRAFVDAETGLSIGSDPTWIGWDSDGMAVLRD